MTPRRWVAITALTALLLIMLLPTAKSWYDQRQELSDLHEQVATQEEHVSELKHEQKLWETDAYVEAQARKRLKFVKPGEKTYTVVDGDGSPSIDPETGTVAGKSSEAWYEQMASSAEAADDPATDR